MRMEVTYEPEEELTVQLQTERLILRDYEKSDIEEYFKLKSDAETMYYLQDIRLFSMEEAEADLASVLLDMSSSDRKYYFFHIEDKVTKEQLGSVGYTVTDNTPIGKLVHLGYFIYPRFWNRGYVTEAVRRVLEFAFLENGVYRVTTGCLADNIGSERVMQKCGMIKEAEHIDWEWHDDRMKTRLEYRLLKSEWESNL